MATKTTAREAGTPVTLKDIQTALATLDDLTKQFVEQYPAAVRGQAFLSDSSFAKAQNALAYLNNNPELFAALSRSELADGIQNFLDFQSLQRGLDVPFQRIESIRKYQSQKVHRLVLGIYDAAKSSVKTGISADPRLARPLVDDLSELFEKSIATRRKNRAKQKQLEEETAAQKVA